MRFSRVFPLLTRHHLALAVALTSACAVLIAAHPVQKEGTVRSTPASRRLAAQASSRGLRPGQHGFERMMGVGPTGATPTASPLPSAAAIPVAEAIPIRGRVSPDLIAESAARAEILPRLAAVQTAGGARPDEPIDKDQPSIAEPLASDALDLGPGTTAAFAYIEPYREPDSWAYRNYCGPGAAIALLSHWDRSYPSRANIEQIGAERLLDPNMGVSILNMIEPINRRLNEITGQDVGWYRYGEAASLDDLRYMLRTDLAEHGIPLITGLMTGGLPGWGAADVGHFVAIYGYTRTADGAEYVSYADTAAPVSNYYGSNLHVWELESFWQAVSRNCGQVW